MDENLSCRVCLGDYDGNNHNPVLLPACGHTFCAFCIDQLFMQNKRACPECRKNNAIQRASTLPVNYSLLSIVQSRHKKPNHHRPDVHPSPLHPGRPHKPTPSESPPTPRHPHPTSRPTPIPTARVTPSLSAERLGQSGSPPSASQVSCSPPRPRSRQSGSPGNNHSLSSLVRAQRHGPDRSTSFSSGSAAVRARPPLSSVRRSRSQQGSGDVGDLASSLSQMQIGGRRPQHSPHRTPPPKDHKVLQEELDFQMAVHLTFCKDPRHRHDDHSSHTSQCWQYPADQDLSTVLALSRTHQD